MEVDELIDTLSGFTLFADLARPDVEAVAHTFEEEWFAAGQRVMRQGFTGTGFYVIIDGEATVRIDGEDRAKLGRGDFFGELSILLDDPPVADVVALTPMQCIVLPRQDLDGWLRSQPSVMLRMLQAELRRLRTANRWRQ